MDETRRECSTCPATARCAAPHQQHAVSVEDDRAHAGPRRVGVLARDGSPSDVTRAPAAYGPARVHAVGPVLVAHERLRERDLLPVRGRPARGRARAPRGIPRRARRRSRRRRAAGPSTASSVVMPGERIAPRRETRAAAARAAAPSMTDAVLEKAPSPAAAGRCPRACARRPRARTSRCARSRRRAWPRDPKAAPGTISDGGAETVEPQRPARRRSSDRSRAGRRRPRSPPAPPTTL